MTQTAGYLIALVLLVCVLILHRKARVYWNRTRRPDGVTKYQAQISIDSLMEQRIPVLANVERLRKKLPLKNPPSEKVASYLKEAEFLLSQYDSRIEHFKKLRDEATVIK